MKRWLEQRIKEELEESMTLLVFGKKKGVLSLVLPKDLVVQAGE